MKFNGGVSEAALAAFEQKFGVSLPSDLRDYFLTMDGMPEEETDDEMIRFWRLEEVKALPTAARSYASGDYIDNPESLSYLQITASGLMHTRFASWLLLLKEMKSLS